MEGFSDGSSTLPASTIERISEPYIVWGKIFVQTKDTLYHNGRGCLPLFSGETVRFGTFQRTQNHFVLRQCPLPIS